MSAFELAIDGDWASHIAAIRDATTEDTNLIRFDNSHYRICRDDSGSVEIALFAESLGGRGIVPLTVQVRDLYVTQIGHRPFETYAANLDMKKMAPQAQSLRSAVHTVQKGQVYGEELMVEQSLLILCVAESIRSDYTATAIQQTIRASTKGLLGVPIGLRTSELLRAARSYGQASDATFNSLPPDAQRILTKPRASLAPSDRQRFWRADVNKIDTQLRDVAKAIKVLKRPG